MFYVEGYEVRNDNIYAHCPDCKRMVYVDMEKLLKNTDATFADSEVFCKECSEKHLNSLDMIDF